MSSAVGDELTMPYRKKALFIIATRGRTYCSITWASTRRTHQRIASRKNLIELSDET